jgi:hypothetical protein
MVRIMEGPKDVWAKNVRAKRCKGNENVRAK